MYTEQLLILGYYADSIDNPLPTFLDNLSVPSSGFILRMGPVCCSETSVRNYYYSLRNNPKERNSQLLRGGSLKSCKIHLNLVCLSFMKQQLFVRTSNFLVDTKISTGSVFVTQLSADAGI